ncbi:hypothetical protein G6O69_14140 [Pseudenhygromyxa sp. WMMC2535]|uniref:hypothetical protein n=1 Tax=Pseudenhygromyxa sp. WMMC2535 TaxID=2712867 RepID=UPI001551DA32|nr:hypothetical protein [Pseudenhygromyxa sp. WMMC2535]NVB38978.1 hypothetical protein [Pseudenhygromyxa sp. WMMC2535]
MSAFALSAAALFLGACDKTKSGEGSQAPAEQPPAASSQAKDAKVKCFGVNECAGQSVCAVNKPELGIEHACAGENECKGKGWIKLSSAECDDLGGEIL